MSRFTDKVALVTGAGSGIGQAVCERLLSEDARVIALDRNVVTEPWLLEAGDRASSLQVDLGEPIDHQLIDDLGPVDILVNAAGVLHRSPIVDHSVTDWDVTMAVNVEAPYRLASLFVRQRLRSGLPGAIVNICSIESFTAAPNHIAYTTSKSAVLMLTRSFALELAASGIRVNAIAPGVTETGMNLSLREDLNRAAALTAQIPMKRFGLAAEQASAVAFLASDEASYITGAVLPVDGGWLTA